MSLTGSLYSGISGLFSHSRSMSVIGNNLANASTIGFKSGTMQFEDLFYSQVNVSNGIGQIGHGATVSTINTSFQQGPYESSAEATHIAMGGNGFFMVDNPETGARYYTRAGNFKFDNTGYLIDPKGYRVQGWDARRNTTTNTVETVGSLGDIKMDTFQSPASPTTKLTLISNLQNKADDKSTDATDPFFALHKKWDGSKNPPLAADTYAYQNTIKVYDEAGSAHDVTVYFDPVKDPVASQAGGKRVWEFVVTCDPQDDGRTLGGTQLKGTSSAGLLMSGTITFNTSGEMEGMTAFTLGAGATGDLHALNNWTPAEFSDNGFPVFTANFAGKPNASATSEADANTIELNLGLRNKDSAGWASPPANAAALGSTFSNLFTFSEKEKLANATTSTGLASTTPTAEQDGFPTGYYQGIEIDKSGILRARYSNGQFIDLFVLGLADFDNLQGLKQEGGNLFSKTLESGEARTGRAGTVGMGNVWSQTLEQSNVDVAREMVRLITTQRGYQANSKTITTSDQMLQEAIQLKR